MNYPWLLVSTLGVFVRAAALHAIWNWFLVEPTGLTITYTQWLAIMAVVNLTFGYRYDRLIYNEQEPAGFFGAELTYAFFTPCTAIAFFGLLHLVIH